MDDQCVLVSFKAANQRINGAMAGTKRLRVRLGLSDLDEVQLQVSVVPAAKRRG
jgi:hypothetical protein